MSQALSIDIFGKVQGVFFRASAKQMADKYHLRGFVTNSGDGTVHIEVAGSSRNIDKFVTWCHSGPRHAQVAKVSTTPLKHNLSDAIGFTIL